MTEHDYFLPVTDLCQRLDWDGIFGAPSSRVEVELGAGDGGFVAAMAQSNPDTHFLALERLLGRARKIARKALRGSLSNLRVLRLESAYTVRYLIPAQSVDVIHVMHPDPWPKKKHFKHRLFQHGFIRDCCTALKPGGELRVTMDHPGYFCWIMELFLQHPEFQMEYWRPEPGYPLSEFQSQFFAENKLVLRQLFRKA